LHQLNVPLSERVLQLEDALERWRWLPAGYSHLPVVVNIPEYILRTFVSDHKIDMRMNVVVGKVLDQTPVFAKDMKYIVFRPYWNVPLDITRAEIVPSLRKNNRYLEQSTWLGQMLTCLPVLSVCSRLYGRAHHALHSL